MADRITSRTETAQPCTPSCVTRCTDCWTAPPPEVEALRPILTPEQRDHALRVIGATFDMAARKIDSGRSSMPITIDDALLLAALAAHGLSEISSSPGTPSVQDGGDAS